MRLHAHAGVCMLAFLQSQTPVLTDFKISISFKNYSLLEVSDYLQYKCAQLSAY